MRFCPRLLSLRKYRPNVVSHAFPLFWRTPFWAGFLRVPQSVLLFDHFMHTPLFIGLNPNKIWVSHRAFLSCDFLNSSNFLVQEKISQQLTPLVVSIKVACYQEKCFDSPRLGTWTFLPVCHVLHLLGHANLMLFHQHKSHWVHVITTGIREAECDCASHVGLLPRDLAIDLTRVWWIAQHQKW